MNYLVISAFIDRYVPQIYFGAQICAFPYLIAFLFAKNGVN